MIGSLRGTLIERSPQAVLVEVGGVGYRAVVPVRTAADLGPPGSEVFLHTHLRVRQDDLSLYGFGSRDERACFEALIGAHGVGPGLAVAILSVHRPDDLRRALVDDDAGALRLVPGVGARTAARLLVELKPRLVAHEVDPAAGNGRHAAGGEAGSRARAEVREALATLGYGPAEVGEAVANLPAEGDVSHLLKAALAHLAGASRQP